jgi:chromosome segregation ATPase
MSTHEEHVANESHEHDPTRPHSFDLTLELERQLDAESLPTSPARPEGRPQSLDTNILASLVTSLRINVAELTKERDELSASLKDAHGREEELTSEVRQLKEAQAERDTELVTLRQKVHDDEESIVLLRSKVEESRFGLSLLSRLLCHILIIVICAKAAVSCDYKLKVAV